MLCPGFEYIFNACIPQVSRHYWTQGGQHRNNEKLNEHNIDNEDDYRRRQAAYRIDRRRLFTPDPDPYRGPGPTLTRAAPTLTCHLTLEIHP
jgi:hypothetical protein